MNLSMHRILRGAAAGLAVVLALASCAKAGKASLKAYAYDSFVSEWGPGPEAVKAFKEKTGIDIILVPKGDAGQVLAAAIQEKRRPEADILIGLDQNLLPKALGEGLLEAYAAAGLERVPEALRFPGSWLTPYDYGSFAIIWDSLSGLEPPASLDDLVKPMYAKKLILMDPRSSSPGLGFLSWTLSRYGKAWGDYWMRLKPSILTIASGWDSGYGLFLEGEAPLVLSYTTSPAYHLHTEGHDRYKALVFAEGHPVQIEGAGLLKGSRNKKAAKLFLDFILSDTFQASLALTNWMFPAVESTPLPPAYSAAPYTATIPAPSVDELAAALADWPETF